MGSSVDEYVRASEVAALNEAHVDGQVNHDSCVLETLALLDEANVRYVIADNFGYAVSYCWRRLLMDLVSPAERGGDGAQEHWERRRVGFAATDLALAWSAARRAFLELLDSFINDGYTLALADRLREIVNHYGLDLELGDIFTLPQDADLLLARIGSPFAWWDDAVESPEQEEQTFDFDREEHRALLTRRLHEENGQV